MDWMDNMDKYPLPCCPQITPQLAKNRQKARRRKRYNKKHRKQTAFQGAAGGKLAQDCGWIVKKDFRKAPQKI